MWKKILGGFVVFIVLVFILVMYATSGLTDTAEKFFAYVSSKNYNQAYLMLSEDFKSTTSKEKLKEFLEKNGFSKYKSASWGNRSVDGNRGELEGSIQTVDGSAIPVTLKMVQDGDGSWKIYAIHKPESGIIEDKEKNSATQSKKTEATQKVEQSKEPVTEALKPVKSDNGVDKKYVDMVKNTIHTFALSVNEKSMSRMHNDMAELFKKQIDLNKMNQLFKSFIEKNINLTVVDPLNPIFDQKPEVNADGVLELKGHYATTPSILRFDFEYIKENGVWKPIGINIQVGK